MTPTPATLYAFLARFPHCSSAQLARQFGLPLRTAAAYRATFTRRTGQRAILSARHGSARKAVWALPDAPLELASTGWLRLHPHADLTAVPEALQAFLVQPRRVRFTAHLTIAPGPPKRRQRRHSGDPPSPPPA